MTTLRHSDIPRTTVETDPLAHAVLMLAEVSIGKDHLSLGEVLTAVGKEGPAIAAALLCLPFMQPIPLPGLSTPVGFAISVSGIGLFLQRDVKLPTRLCNVQLPTTSVLKATEFLARFEVKLKPYLRSESAFESTSARRFLGLMIAIHGALLALPLPIPFSNTMPAWTCFFSSLALLFESRKLFWFSTFLVTANILFWSVLLVGTVWGSATLAEWLGVT